jgi:hypothetical protein
VCGLSHSQPSASLPRPHRSTSARLLRTWPAPRARWSTPFHREGRQPLLVDGRQIPTRRTSVPITLWTTPSFFWWQWRVLPRKMPRPRKPTRRSVRESMLAPASPRTGRRGSAACQIRLVKSQRGFGPIHPNSPITPARRQTLPEFQIRWSTGRDHECSRLVWAQTQEPHAASAISPVSLRPDGFVFRSRYKLPSRSARLPWHMPKANGPDSREDRVSVHLEKYEPGIESRSQPLSWRKRNGQVY